MKTVSIALAIAAATVAMPALADAPAGARAEVVAGYDRVSLDLGGFGLGSYSKDGVAFALAGGYDMAVGNALSIGLDAEVGDSTTKYVYDDGIDRVTLSTGRDLYVGGRVTAAINPKINLYAKAGYTNARIKGSINGFSESDNGDGVRVGLGGQLGLSDSAYALIEYRYSDYEAGFSRNQVLTGIGLRF